MSWNHTANFIIPIELQLVAKQISRSLDPDVGGYEAFETYLSADGNQPATHVAYSTPCKESFVELLSAAMASAEYLKAAVDADYAVRWADLEPPTLAECQAFIDGLAYEIDANAIKTIEANNLKIIIQNANLSI